MVVGNVSGSGDVECSDEVISDQPAALLLFPLLFSVLWVLLDLFYSSTALGWLVTRLTSFFLRQSAIHIGSIQFSPLTGRILFKDVHYYNRDYSVRIADGYVALHWWKRSGLGKVSCWPDSVEKQNALVLFQFNGFQLHWYNRSDVYDNWGQVSAPEGDNTPDTTRDSLVWSLWKDLRPSLYFSIKKGRLVFGNHLLEKSVAVYCETAEAHYHTMEASNDYDEMMHVVRIWSSEIKAVLETSTGEIQDSVDQLLRSDSATVTYSWDSPGLVPLGDTPPPQFSWHVELGSNSVINYGSYANHHRNHLQRFFFPNDYVLRLPSYIPQPGEKRIYYHMDISVTLSSKGFFNIPFRDKNNKLHQIGFSLEEGSEVKVHQPWVTNENGYVTRVTGILQSVVVTSDLSYPHLASAASLELDISLTFPRIWNGTQTWDMKLSASKVEISVLFSYIDFINALIDDWLGSEDVDLLHFVPVKWEITASLLDYEIFLFTSRYNWLDIDCLENARLAFCGPTGTIQLSFPFTVFNPTEQAITFSANGQDMVVRHYIPPSDSAKEVVLALAEANKHRWRLIHSNTELEDRDEFPMGYRGQTKSEDGWLDLACGPRISLNISYISRNHHPIAMVPHTLTIDVSAPQVLLRTYGFLLQDLLGLKENYPGIYLEFSTYQSSLPSESLSPTPNRTTLTKIPLPSPPRDVPDWPQERFIDVIVDFALENITAEFPTFPSNGCPVSAALPSLCCDRLAVHVDYTVTDTKVFLNITPFTVLIPSWGTGIDGEIGHVVCRGLSLNCHGLTDMLVGERVEYAWLMQLDLQKITASFSTAQLAVAGSWMESIVQQVIGVADAKVEAPNCQPIRPKVEPIAENVKYILFDFSMAEIDLYMLEGNGLMKLQSPGLDVSMCNLHSEGETLGLSLQIHSITCSVGIPLTGGLHKLSETGQLSVGTLQADISLTAPEDCVPQRQRCFLQRADERTQRLWFLWNDNESINCGCCGGCQFLDSCISRRPILTFPPRLNAKSTHTLSLTSLKKSLQSVKLKDFTCPNLLHAGLQTYYERSFQPSPVQRCTTSDTESFASARASLSSGSLYSDTKEHYYSLQDVNEAGLDEHITHKDLRSSGNEGTVSDPLQSLLPSYKYHVVVLHINGDRIQGEDMTPGQHKFSDTQCPGGDNPSESNRTKGGVVLKLPNLSPDTSGKLPSINSKRIPLTRNKIAEQSSRCQYGLRAHVKVLGPVSAVLSPPTTKLIISMTQSLTNYFSQRSAEAVLTSCSLQTSLSLESYLTKLMTLAKPNEFSANLSLAVEPSSTLCVQFVQSHSIHKPPLGGPVCSFVTAVVSNLSLCALFKTCSETTTKRLDKDKATINSLQISLQGNSSSLQVSLAAQLSSGHKSCPNLFTNPGPQPPLLSPSSDVYSLVEAGCSSVSFTMATKLVTMEISPKVVLTWDHVHGLEIDRSIRTSIPEEVDNQFALSLSLPQVWINIAAPTTGTPSSSTGYLDPLLGYGVGVAWHNQLVSMVKSVQQLQRVKQERDRRIILTLLANAACGSLEEKVACNLVTPVANAVRHCVAFHCLHQIWLSIPFLSQTQLKSIPTSHSCRDELLSIALLLATRIYSEEYSSVARNKLCSSPTPIESATCPTCGPYRVQQTSSSNASSVSANGYIKGISPSPSELALPNASFNNQQLYQWDFSKFESVPFEKMVVIRESLLPLLNAIGISATPQLHVPCHNKKQLRFECSIQLREGSVFVMEPFSTTTTPVLQLEQVSVQGQLQINTNTPRRRLLSPAFSLTFITEPEDSGRERINSRISSHFCTKICVVNIGITESLMKLCRHVHETSRVLPHDTQLHDEHTSSSDETPSQASSDLWEFIQQLIEQLRELQSPPVAVSFSRPPSASSVHSRSVRAVMSTTTDVRQQSPVAYQTGSDHISLPADPSTPLPSFESSSSDQANTVEQVVGPMPSSPVSQSPLDTSGADLPSSDDMHLSSESQCRPDSPVPPTTDIVDSTGGTHWIPDVIPLQHILQTQPNDLSHSIFGLLRIDSVSVSLQVETSTSYLRVAGITGSVDSRRSLTAVDPWPSYLSLMATFKTSQLGVSDRNIDMMKVLAQPVHLSVGLCRTAQLTLPSYRCLLKMLGCQLVVKQPPVLVHKRLQLLLPAFTHIYQEVFSSSKHSLSPDALRETENVMVAKMPSRLPQGYSHFSMSRVELVMTPLPSLSITYSINPLNVNIITSQTINYCLSVGSHSLRFNPREQQVTLRSLALPTVRLSGDMSRSPVSSLPLVSLSLTVQKVNIDLTTDSLNQLLVLQNSFIKEVNELAQLFISIGENIPQQHWQSVPPDNGGVKLEHRDSDTGNNLLSLLDSCRLSIDEICVTVSTPLCTALRFQTSRIDMLIKNARSPNLSKDGPVMKTQLLLSGRVEVHLNLALGYLQDSSSEDDDFCELAYFKTKISVKNTQQNAPRLSVVEGNKEDVPLDTFLISIICPHLYVQSSAVEQAILFWLNCKSVYGYWQHQRKLLNEEVQEATEHFVAQIQSHRPTNLQTSSLDFSKPRLVQISMTDVGVCMPMATVLYPPQSSQSFPALVLTVKEMSLVLNLSRRVASSGSVSGFCLRFANQFTLRQRTWTTDLKKNKMINCGIVNQGTFRLCVATKKQRSEEDPSVVLGEKLVWAFQWDMSGIDVNANSDIGHHLSTLVRTATTIGTSLEGQRPTHLARTTAPATPPAKTPRKFLYKRAMSEAVTFRHETKKEGMEESMTNLAKGTIHVSNLRSLGASRESIKREMEALKETEQQLRKNVGKLFRRRRGFSIQRIAEFFKPSSGEGVVRRRVQRRWTLKNPRRLFSTGDSQSIIPEEENPHINPPPLRTRAKTLTGAHHSRTISDVTEQYIAVQDESSSPNLTPSVTPVPGDEAPPSPFPSTPFSSTPTHQTFSFQPKSQLQYQAQPSSSLVSSIDVEINVIVNIDSGIVKLRCKEESISDHRSSSPSLLAQAHYQLTHGHSSSLSTFQSRKLQNSSTGETVIILIPALNVEVHYKSLVGHSYQFPSPSATASVEHALPKIEITPGTPGSVVPPTKRGVLAVSVVVKSTPEDMTLNPSLLEFVEQVVRPTIAATSASSKTGSSSEGDSEEESEVEDEGKPEKSDTLSISFPVDVTIVFHMQPSRVFFSCQPHSRVHCIVCSPNVDFVVSFSLFSAREVEGQAVSPSQLSLVSTFNNLNVTGCLRTFTLQVVSPQVSSLKQPQTDSTKKAADKEALSLTLGQALLHLSRKSVVVMGLKASPGRQDHCSTLQVSVVASIASLVLGYDMRRLNDLTTFRRYWYRTSLVESFIGSKEQQQPEVNTHEEKNEESVDSGESPEHSTSAAIVIAASVEDFRISANVAQVMGNTNLVVTHLQCQVHADVSHNELVVLRLIGRMEKGDVDARGGVVAGTVLMQNVLTKVTTESHCGLIPVHSAEIRVADVETRIDYMSSCILLGRVSDLMMEGKDLWEGLQLSGHEDQMEDANIEVLVVLAWNQAQLAIQRTTTKSLMNIVQKIQDFILQQKRRSERTISIMLPADTRVSKALAAYREREKQAEQHKDSELRSGHHWLWATHCGSVELMKALGVSSSSNQRQVSLGGKISVSGQNFCLVCFHGTSFRDHEWAVFNIDQVSASFLTLAIPGLETVARGRTRTCQQICQLQLGESGTELDVLATVHRVTAGKGRVPAITGTNINDWLAYACIDSHLHQQSYEHPTQAQQNIIKSSKKLNIQQILLVPRFSLKLINDHFWPVLNTESPQSLISPVVECSLLSQFSAPISVSTSVDHYLFLHDLVVNYVEYMERHKAPLKDGDDGDVGKDVKKEEKATSEISSTNVREFECVSWKLEPRLTLLSSVSGEFNPHINWLLQKLGFKHAQTTIPKWVQRGAMDPLDKGVAFTVEQLIHFSAKKKLTANNYM